MFSNIGWGEIFVIVVLGVIIIGPERLPGVIEDVRAALFAARKAINNAKAELNGELGEVSKEFDALRGPISTAAEWGRLGPRAAITKALFDGEDLLDPATTGKESDTQQVRTGTSTHAASTQAPSTPGQPTGASFDYSQIYAPVEQSPQRQPEPQIKQPDEIKQPDGRVTKSTPLSEKPSGQSGFQSDSGEDKLGSAWQDVI